MKKITFWWLWAFAATILLITFPSITGCSWIRGVCAKSMPVIVKAQGYEHDAEIAIDQAEAAFARMDLPPDVRKKADIAIASARQTLRVASIAINSAADACSSPDAFALLDDFIRVAWPAIAALLGEHSQQLGAAPGAEIVQTPDIVVQARARGIR